MSAIRPAASSQPAQALQLANGVRRARSVLKARVAEGQLAAAEVILICPSEIASMPVAQLLASQRGWGEARSRAFLAQVAVREDKSVGSLTERQRRAVAALLTRTVACAELSSSPPRVARRRGSGDRKLAASERDLDQACVRVLALLPWGLKGGAAWDPPSAPRTASPFHAMDRSGVQF